jgi:hypothetical protein
MSHSLKSRQETLLKTLQEKDGVAYGAIGTIIYSSGIPFSTSFDELIRILSKKSTKNMLMAMDNLLSPTI